MPEQGKPKFDTVKVFPLGRQNNHLNHLAGLWIVALLAGIFTPLPIAFKDTQADQLLKNKTKNSELIKPTQAIPNSTDYTMTIISWLLASLHHFQEHRKIIF